MLHILKNNTNYEDTPFSAFVLNLNYITIGNLYWVHRINNQATTATLQNQRE